MADPKGLKALSYEELRKLLRSPTKRRTSILNEMIRREAKSDKMRLGDKVPSDYPRGG